MAADQPHVAAVKIPRRHKKDGHIEYLTLTFAELDAEVDAWCARLKAHGVEPGEAQPPGPKPGEKSSIVKPKDEKPKDDKPKEEKPKDEQPKGDPERSER